MPKIHQQIQKDYPFLATAGLIGSAGSLTIPCATGIVRLATGVAMPEALKKQAQRRQHIKS